MGYNYWTPEEDAQLIKLYENHSTTEIGKIMNRNQSSVTVRCKKLGLKRAEPVKEKFKFSNTAKFYLGYYD